MFRKRRRSLLRLSDMTTEDLAVSHVPAWHDHRIGAHPWHSLKSSLQLLSHVDPFYTDPHFGMGTPLKARINRLRVAEHNADTLLGRQQYAVTKTQEEREPAIWHPRLTRRPFIKDPTDTSLETLVLLP